MSNRKVPGLLAFLAVLAVVRVRSELAVRGSKAGRATGKEYNLS